MQFQTLYMEFLLSVGTVSPVMQQCPAAAEEQKSECTHGSVEVFESLLPDPDSDNTLSQRASPRVWIEPRVICVAPCPQCAFVSKCT